MAQSGSYDATVTRDNIIDDAHLYIGAIGEGESASASQVTEAARLLNMIVKLRAADGMPAWALRRGFLLPVTDVSSVNTVSHVVTAYDTTTLSAASAANDTTLTVTSITGFSNADQIGIELDNGNMDWTTVSGAPSGTTITIATGVTTAAASGNRIYGYTASTERVQKPLRIINANILNVGVGSSWPIDVVSHQEYFALSNRTSDGGQPNQLFYTLEPSSLTALETNGKIFIFPRFYGGDYIVEFSYHRPFADFDAAGDNPDFPQAFHLPLMLELASLIAPKFGVPIEERAALKAEAKFYRQEALGTIFPEGSLYLGRESY